MKLVENIPLDYSKDSLKEAAKNKKKGLFHYCTDQLLKKNRLFNHKEENRKWPYQQDQQIK